MQRLRVVLLVVLCACARESVDQDALLDPASCAGCHPDQYKQWAASSHAFASDDPIFTATDRRGQRETAGALGGFCLACHAPMAARVAGASSAAQLAGVPRSLRGVTCYFCHEATAVHGDHDAPIDLAGDGVMRGGFGAAMANPAHASARSALLDERDQVSSSLCGSCHDVVAPSGVRLESTYVEWQASVFASATPAGVSCAGCHMLGSDGASAAGAAMPTRRVHDHTFAGLDVPSSSWAGNDLVTAGIERDLGPSISSKICVSPAGVDVTLDDVTAGHAWPSGVTHARRAWVELVARRAGAVVYQTGVVPAGDDPADLADPDLWLMRSRLLDANGAEVEMPWQAASLATTGLTASVTTDRNDARFYHAVTRTFFVPPADDIELHVRITPVGAAVVRGLEASGDLAPADVSAIPVFDVAPAARTWHSSDGYGCVPR